MLRLRGRVSIDGTGASDALRASLRQPTSKLLLSRLFT